MNKDTVIEKINAAKSIVKTGDHEAAFRALTNIINEDYSYTVQYKISRIFESLDISEFNFTPIKVAILATSTVDHILPILKFWLSVRGLNADLWLAPYDMLPAMCLDQQSTLYKENPDVIWLYTNWRDVEITVSPFTQNPSGSNKEKEIAVDKLIKLATTASNFSNAQVVINNADVPSEELFGNLEGSVDWSRRNLLRSYNLRLAEKLPDDILLMDLDHLASTFGKSRWFDPKYWFHSKHAQTLDAMGLLSSSFSALIAGSHGMSKKCLVLDLDNTIWGGVIGDDGIEGINLGHGVNGECFQAIQKYCKSLKERGIILAVCSKNDESTAKEPFLSHPDMVLTLDDISVFVANWNNKAENISHISEVLNIGLESIVFVDDNPVERDLVRNLLPLVTVPSMPSDPAYYTQFLQNGRYFEAISFSDEDRKRSNFYKSNANRNLHQQNFADLGSFLEDLKMVAEFDSINEFYLPRATQLINKSNQFNLTGKKYTEKELLKLSQQPSSHVLYFKLSDKFGDNGLISVIIFHKHDLNIVIDNWVMSCRVLGRQMEEFVVNELVRISKKYGAKKLLGEFVSSGRNNLVAELFKKLGFKKVEQDLSNTNWVLDIDNSVHFKTSIKNKNSLVKI